MGEYLLRKRWLLGGVLGSKRAKTAAVKALARVFKRITKVPPKKQGYRALPSVVCITGSSGAGKTCTVIDATRKCGYIHLHVSLSSFLAIVKVVEKRPALFASTSSGLLARRDIVTGFSQLYRKELGEFFLACRDSIVKGGPDQSTRGVFPRPVESFGDDESVEDAWSSLLVSIPVNRRVVIHIEECQDLFGGCAYLQGGDLFEGKDDDMYSRPNAPRFALRAFVEALEPFVARSRKIVWVFTGLQPSISASLSIPGKLACSDLSRSLVFLSAQQVYSVFAHYAKLSTPYTKTHSGVRYFMKLMVGPPLIVTCMLDALYELRVPSIPDMIARRVLIESHIRQAIRVRVPRLSMMSHVELKFCCIAPFVKEEQFRINVGRIYWSNLVADGLVHLRVCNDSKQVNANPQFEEMRYVCEMVPLYPILLDLLCDLSGTSTLFVSLLSRMSESDQDKRNCGDQENHKCGGEMAFLALLASPRSPGTARWLSTFGISDCLQDSTRVEFADEIDFCVEQSRVVHSCVFAHGDCTSQIAFEAVVSSDHAAYEGEKVVVVFEITYNERQSEEIARDISNLVQRAIGVYEGTSTTIRYPRRSIIVLVAARMNLLEVDQDLAKQYANSKHVSLNPYQSSEASGVQRDSAHPRPCAVFLIGPDSPIWSEMPIAVEDIPSVSKCRMRNILLDKFAPNFETAFHPDVIERKASVNSSHNMRGTTSFVSDR